MGYLEFDISVSTCDMSERSPFACGSRASSREYLTGELARRLFSPISEIKQRMKCHQVKRDITRYYS